MYPPYRNTFQMIYLCVCDDNQKPYAKNSPKMSKMAISETWESDNNIYRYKNVWICLRYIPSVLIYFENLWYPKTGLE